MLVVDAISETVDKLALRLDDDVDGGDCALVEGCPARLNSLDTVSAGCTMAASVDPAAADSAVRVADVNRAWLSALVVRTLLAELLVDTTLGSNGVVVNSAEEVAARDEVTGLAADDGIIDEEDIVTMVEVWASGGIEGVSVLLRNRAAL